MIFLRVLSKIFLWPHYSGALELGGPGSLNRLNPRFPRHCHSARKHDHVTPLLRELHWLRMRQRIDYKLAVLIFRCLYGQAPPYLTEGL